MLISVGCIAAVLVMNEDALHYPAYTAASLPERTAGKVNELTGLSSKRLPPECTLTKEGVERYIDSATKGRLTHFFINVNYQRAFYPSKVIEPVWASLDEPERAAPTDITSSTSSSRPRRERSGRPCWRTDC